MLNSEFGKEMLMGWVINNFTCEAIFKIPRTKVIAYIEVAQGGVSSRAIHNWFWIFSLFFDKKKIQKKYQIKLFFIKEILCNFLVRSLQCFFFKYFFFAHKNMKKPASKVAHNWPQILFSVLPTGPKSAQISYSVS